MGLCRANSEPQEGAGESSNRAAQSRTLMLCLQGGLLFASIDLVVHKLSVVAKRVSISGSSIMIAIALRALVRSLPLTLKHDSPCPMSLQWLHCRPLHAINVMSKQCASTLNHFETHPQHKQGSLPYLSPMFLAGGRAQPLHVSGRMQCRRLALPDTGPAQQSSLPGSVCLP